MPKPVEVEIRVLLKNRRIVEDKLKQFGGKLVYHARLKDYWYCPIKVKNYRQAMVDKVGFALRIRETHDSYSGKTSSSLDCKTFYEPGNHALCHEHEIDLTDARQMRNILVDIGLKNFLFVDKQRTVYQYKSAKFCFDKIKGIGEGLEIEIMAKNNIKAAHGKILELAEQLGIKKSEILKYSLTYLAMQKLSRF